MPGNINEVPPSVIAHWPKPNYVDPVHRSWMPAYAGTLCGVSTVLIAGRFYLRARREAGDFGLDDIFIFIGWLFGVGITIGAAVSTNVYGEEFHTWDVRPNLFEKAALLGWCTQVFFLVSTCATKASILLFYRRVAKDSYSKAMLYAIWLMLGLTGALFVALLITYCLICQPLEAYWLYWTFKYDKPFKCIDGNVLDIFMGVFSVCSDVYSVLLPCIWLHRYDLHVSRWQRVGLNLVFSLGTIVAGCGIARTYYLWQLNHTYDTSWTAFDLFVWSLLEVHLAIIFACAPSLRAFVRRYFGETLRSSRNRGTGQTASKRRTGDFDQNVARGASALDDVEAGAFKRGGSITEQRILVSPEPVIEPFPQRATSPMSTHSRSSEAIHTDKKIRTADDYEAFALKQLSRYTSGFKRNVTMDRLSANSSVVDHYLEEDDEENVHGWSPKSEKQ